MQKETPDTILKTKLEFYEQSVYSLWRALDLIWLSDSADQSFSMGDGYWMLG